MQSINNNTESNEFATPLQLSNHPNFMPPPVSETSTKTSKINSKKIKKSDILFKRISKIDMHMSNLTSIVTKYVKYTNKKIEDFESKIEELEKRLQNKQDIRHSVKFVMD